MRLFDLHCDTLYRAYTEKSTLFNDNFHISFNRTEKISPYIQCLAVWIPDEYRGQDAENLFLGCVNKLNEQLSGTDIKQCRTASDIEYLKKENKKGVILTVEGGAILGGKTENIALLKKYGVKMMTLTWNGRNELGDGIGEEADGGLTEFGKTAVKELEKNNIVIDISHAGQKLFYDVVEIAEKPFCASHSNSKAIAPHRRNLTDEQFSIIKSHGGLVGMNFCVDFLNKKATNAEMYDIIKNTEHFLSLGGEKTLAMGGDFDGADIPKDMTGIESMPELYEMFLKHNYSQSLIDDIFFGNAYNFFKKQM